MTISSEQQELIDLLRSELAEIINYDTAALAADSSVERMPLLEDFEIHVDNIGNAARLVGLLGLAQCCKHLAKNFVELVSVGAELPQGLIALLRAWPHTLLDYLHCFAQPQKETQTVDALLALLAESDWPIELSEGEQDQIREMFLQSSVEIDEDAHSYPVVITDEMASMSVADDINPELLKGLLIELPTQVDAFDRAVEQYLITKQSVQLRIAQRVAHTLKGAANVVGIAGMANLMHYLEDILEVVDKRGVVPEGIDDLLQDSADCLSAMSEFLAGIGPRPTDVKSTIEAVLEALRPEELLLMTPADVGSFAVAANEELRAGDIVDLEALAFDEALEIAYEQQLSREESGTEGAEIVLSDGQRNSDLDDEDVPLLDAELEPFTTVADFIGSSDLDLIPTLGDVYHRPGNVFSSDIQGSMEVALPASIAVKAQPDSTQGEVNSKGVIPAVLNRRTAEPAPVEDESAPLSVSEAQAQELLRLTGESQIGNTQILNRLDVVAVGIKSAANYQLQLHQLAQELERVVELQTALASATGMQQAYQLDPLELERYNELDSFASQLHEVTTDAYEAITDLDEELKLLKGLVQNQRQLGFDSQELLLNIRMLPVSVFISRFSRCVRQVSRLTGKAAALEIAGEEVLVDSRVLSSMIDPIMHLLRNAVDHGLESAEERIERGKDPCGKITLTFRRVADTVSVECTDDGMGLDYDSIAAKAADKGLVPANVKLGVADLNRLILSSGFSTRTEVTQTSGRGVGLDVVNEQIKMLKGTLAIDSRQGAGTRFTLTAPMTVLSAHTLLVTVGKYKVSIISRALEQIAFVERERLDTSQPQFRYTLAGEEQPLPVFALDKLALMDEYSQNEDYKALIVTQNQEGERCGVLVESIIASEEQIIKPLNRFTMKIEGVVGAAILGDGRVSPVVDLYELPGLSEASSGSQSWRRRFEQRLAHLKLSQPKERPMALVVDDSLSARRSLAQFIGDMGMEVYTAKDGFEAIQLIEQRIPHIILVDLEMPRMNGLELTQHLRAETQTRDIPIIMITSRATEKHKSLATRAGVNAYLNKPWTDEELLFSINSQVAS